MNVTTRDLAREAGVHQATVSRALRNDPRLSVATRLRIQQLARDRDYTPDPMLSALMVYRRKKSPPKYQETLGWMTNYPTRDGWRIHEKVGQFAGASRRAKELGYRLEEFWLREPGMTSQRVTQVLSARNIRGLIFISQPRARAHFNLDWSRFSALSLDHSVSRPILNTVTNHHYHSMQKIMRHLKKLGYRCIGFACWPQVIESVDRNWLAAYSVYQPAFHLKPLPVFNNRSWQRDDFYRWFDEHRPEVVISNDHLVLEWLETRGLSVPRDVGFVMAARYPGESRWAGIDENTERIGAAAVNLLVDMLHRGERGIPEIPMNALVEGTWIPGKTVRRLHSL